MGNLVDELGGAFTGGAGVKVAPVNSALNKSERDKLDKLLGTLNKTAKQDSLLERVPVGESHPEIALPEHHAEIPEHAIPDLSGGTGGKEEKEPVGDSVFPEEWVSKKDLRVDWLLQGEFPPTIQKEVDGVRGFIEDLRKRGGRDPKGGETVFEYWMDVSGGGGSPSSHGQKEPAAGMQGEDSAGDMPETISQTRMTNEERPELPEEVLKRWDEAIEEGAPEAPVVNTGPIPRKPPPEKAEFMRMSAEPRAGRIIDQTLKNSAGKEPAPPPAADPLLFEIIKKHTDPPLTEEQWESVKEKTARDVLNDGDFSAITQSIAALQAANPAEDIAPIDGEKMRSYISRLLPRPKV